jgi:hypothetical protein
MSTNVELYSQLLKESGVKGSDPVIVLLQAHIDLKDQLARAQEALDSQIPKGCLVDLQQKLLQSQASEARLREALGIMVDKDMKKAVENGANSVSMPDYLVEYAVLLSTPPNTTDLDKYVESEIEKRLGEPLIIDSIASAIINGRREAILMGLKLYARKDKQ